MYIWHIFSGAGYFDCCGDAGEVHPIWLSDLKCFGYEAHLEDCLHTPWSSNSCDDDDTISVQCSGTTTTKNVFVYLKSVLLVS